MSITTAGPGQLNEPIGGQPPAGSAPSITDFDYQLKHHRAFEALLWAMPALSIYSFRRDRRSAQQDIHDARL